MKISASQFLKELEKLETKKLEEIKGLGPIMIENLNKFVRSKSFEKLQQQFLELERLEKGLEIDFGQIKMNEKIPQTQQKEKIEEVFEQSLEQNWQQNNSNNAENILAKIDQNSNQNYQKHLKSELENQSKNQILSQKNEENKQVVCITGVFEITRNEIIKKLEENNYEVATSLTKNVTILLAGEKAGSKLEKAVKMGIKIVQNLDELI